MVFPYNVSALGNFSKEFVLGFTRVSTEKRLNKLLRVVYLWHADGTGLKVQSEMHELGEWNEAGSLKFSHVAKVPDDRVCEEVTLTSTNLPDEFSMEVKASKLVLNINDVFVESGILIEGTDGGEIILVAGESPYSIAISILNDTEEFKPEYSLDTYVREPIGKGDCPGKGVSRPSVER